MPAPIIGALASAALSGIFGSVATARANRYNSPAQQRKRLRKAGLPLAYMYGGNVGQQSEVPKLSIDPDLGFIESKRLQQEKSLLDAQIPKIKNESYYQQLINELQLLDNQWYQLFPSQTSGDSVNRWRMLEFERNIEQSNEWIKKYAAGIERIKYQVENNLFQSGTSVAQREQELAKVRQNIVNLVKQTELMDQLKDIRSLESFVNSSITGQMKDQDDFTKGLWSLIMKLFSQSAGR